MSLEELKDWAKDAELEIIKEVISKRMLDVGYGSFFCSNQKFAGLYRARTHNHPNGNTRNGNLEEFLNEKEFWNPPKEFVKFYGRCNDIGESMFYCSNEFEVAITEVGPKVGQYVTVCSFENIPFGDLRNGFYEFRMKPIGAEYLSKIEKFNSCVPKDIKTLKRTKENREMDNFLDELFHESVPEDQNNRYKLTVAVTKIMLTNTINQQGVEHSIHGLMYSSIARNFKGANILFKPKAVNDYFFLKTAQTFKVLENDGKKIAIKLVRNGGTMERKVHPSQPKLDMQWFDIANGDSYSFQI